MIFALAVSILVSIGLNLQGCGNTASGGGSGSSPPTPAPPTVSPPTPTPGPVNPFCKNTSGPSPPSPPPGETIGWNPTSSKEGIGKWCEVGIPDPSWKLNNFCSSSRGGATVNGTGVKVTMERFLSFAGSAQVRILTYNLYWWNLFGKRGGANGMAGKNIAAYAKNSPFDLMGFQECEDISWPLRDAGMTNTHTTYQYQMAVALAFRTAAFDELGRGGGWVAEDSPQQYDGRRVAIWIRLHHRASGKNVFFINHHGPTPVNSGGICGQAGTAFNILKMIGQNAKVGDHVVLTGDFNAWSNGPDGANFPEIGHLSCHLPHVLSNPVISDVWGIDNIFASCARTLHTDIMPKGGSDHNALDAMIELQ